MLEQSIIVHHPENPDGRYPSKQLIWIMFEAAHGSPLLGRISSTGCAILFHQRFDHRLVGSIKHDALEKQKLKLLPVRTLLGHPEDTLVKWSAVSHRNGETLWENSVRVWENFTN